MKRPCPSARTRRGLNGAAAADALRLAMGGGPPLSETIAAAIGSLLRASTTCPNQPAGALGRGGLQRPVIQCWCPRPGWDHLLDVSEHPRAGPEQGCERAAAGAANPRITIGSFDAAALSGVGSSGSFGRRSKSSLTAAGGGGEGPACRKSEDQVHNALRHRLQSLCPDPAVTLRQRDLDR